MTDTASTRERELDDSLEERSPKRTKLDDCHSLNEDHTAPTTSEEENLLPPSHVLLGLAKPTAAADGSLYRISEEDVGISEYVSSDIPRIGGIIKQRYVLVIVPATNTYIIVFKIHRLSGIRS